jgi:hypothetical protein
MTWTYAYSPHLVSFLTVYGLALLASHSVPAIPFIVSCLLAAAMGGRLGLSVAAVMWRPGSSVQFRGRRRSYPPLPQSALS